ncbi:hypothetical protein OSO01_08250 [Oceanobacillus sojae]|uniref:Uncharacterized protein n=1 Tax=Oceanobacillus sojae TaxID=582851 RepID=A0A511ZF61_9BACI|nr:hypothetical protein OSO01_08250 [Oceanobacillus sojae]
MGKHFIEIINEYPIQEVIQTEALDKGNTSEADIVTGTESKYILRKLKSNQQAKTEYFVSNILSDGLAPNKKSFCICVDPLIYLIRKMRGVIKLMYNSLMIMILTKNSNTAS